MAILDSLEETGLSWFWASDAEGRLIYLSAAALEQFGAEGKDILGTPVSDLFEEDNAEKNHETQRTLRFMLAAHNSVPATPVRLAYNQREVWWEISGKPYIDKDGQFAGYRGIACDISEAHQDRRHAERLSQFDALTG
ncbi:MAG: PAS domain-containing protein, partial [Pseudomonadota bacterium]